MSAGTGLPGCECESPGMFSGGSYEEVGRWLWNFLTSHAKRENPRAEVLVDSGDEREGRSYGVRLRLGRHIGPVIEFDYREVAAYRGNLAWCRALAEETRSQVRQLTGPPGIPVGGSE
jgi:hypothetical protein